MVGEAATTLVLGGTRSGKSAVAERLVSELLTVGDEATYVATGAPADGSDPEWRDRVAAHRARRPPAWATVELLPGGDLAEVLAGLGGAALVDSLGTWLAGFRDFDCPKDRLCEALGSRMADGRPTVLVSEEVGLGVHAPSEVGRRFADALGSLNQAVAAVAGRVLLVVAGRLLELPSPVRDRLDR